MYNFNDLSAQSRVWIYQSNRNFTASEQTEIQTAIELFVETWQSHNQALKAWGTLKEERFVVLAVDEQMAGASGCSIDKSVALIKEIESRYSVDMFDRWCFAYKDEQGQVLSANRDEFAQLFAQGAINENTTVFNNLVNTKADLEDKWVCRLADSWHIRMV